MPWIEENRMSMFLMIQEEEFSILNFTPPQHTQKEMKFWANIWSWLSKASLWSDILALIAPTCSEMGWTSVFFEILVISIEKWIATHHLRKSGITGNREWTREIGNGLNQCIFRDISDFDWKWDRKLQRIISGIRESLLFLMRKRFRGS